MAWQTPKTDWKAGDIPAASDFNRIEGDTLYLKDEVDSHKAEDASTTAKGHVQLNNTVTSTSTTQAATASAVKTVNDALTSHKAAAAPHSGHETPAGAQAKANTAETNAKNHANSLVGTLSNLLTTTKNNVVAAINEIFGKVEDVEGDLEPHLVEKATETNLGHVRVDGKTILSDNGVLKWSKNMVVFVHDGTFIVPPDVTTVFVSACGGGGGGGGGVYYYDPDSGYPWTRGGTGGEGGCVIRKPVEVTPGEEIAVTIGAGGSGGRWGWGPPSSGAENGSAGGVTSFRSYVSVGGGGGGKFTTLQYGTGAPGENGTSPITLLNKVGSLFLPYGKGGAGGRGDRDGSPGNSGLLIIEW